MCIANSPFWIFLGDIHGETRNIHKIKDVQNAQAIVITGDIGKSGTVHDTQKVLQEFAAFQKNQTKIYAQIGNMDSLQVDTYLSDNHMNLHGNLIKFETIALFGTGGSLPTPFFTKSEFSEDFYRENLKQFLSLPQDLLTIFVSHNPPYGTLCDRLKSGKHVGSKAVLEFIQDYQPDFCICGHIHESRAKDIIGKTKVYNLGDFASGYYGKLTFFEEDPEMELCTL